MASNYLYKTVLYTNTDGVIGVPASNSTDLTDYENNRQADTIKVDNYDLAETTFTIDKSYSDFSNLISTPFDWTDVREVTGINRYELLLITTSPL